MPLVASRGLASKFNLCQGLGAEIDNEAEENTSCYGMRLYEIVWALVMALETASRNARHTPSNEPAARWVKKRELWPPLFFKRPRLRSENNRVFLLCRISLLGHIPKAAWIQRLRESPTSLG